MVRGSLRRGVLVGAGAIAGILAFGIARLLFLPASPAVHYHANWAILVNGKRLDLSANQYMEDVASCRVDPTQMEPQDRTHLHNNNPDVVHVHAPAATWGALLANLGFGIGDDYLVTDRGERFFADSGRTLTFVLNGKRVPTIRNRVIESRDRLLINFGPEPAAELIRTRFPRVASTAAAFNSQADPAACSGSQPPGFWDRVQHAFWG